MLKTEITVKFVTHKYVEIVWIGDFFFFIYVAIHKHTFAAYVADAVYIFSTYEKLLIFKKDKFQTFSIFSKTVFFVCTNKKGKALTFPFCISCKEVCMYLLVLG